MEEDCIFSGVFQGLCGQGFPQLASAFDTRLGEEKGER
jgi:hypothetical protein